MSDDREFDRWVGELVADSVADAPEAPDLSMLAAASGEAGGRRRAHWGWIGAVAGAGAAAAVIALLAVPRVGDESIREIEPTGTPPIGTEPDPPATTVADPVTTAPVDTTVAGGDLGRGQDSDPEPVTPLAVRADDVPTFVERLEMFPDHASFRNEVLFTDIDVATEIAGLDRPDAGDDEAVLVWYDTLTGGRGPAATGIEALSWGPMWQATSAMADDPDPTRELGIDLTELAWSAHTNMFPPFAVTGGRIDPERVRATADDELDGILRFGRSDWFEPDIEQRSSLRVLGMPIAVGFVDDTMLISRDPDLVRQVRDRDGDTLADVEPLRAAAEVLDLNGAYSARLFSSPEQPSALGATLDAVATGLIVTAAGDREVLLVVVADETTVEAAVDLAVHEINQGTFSLTGEPWRDRFTVRSTTVDGRLGIVRLVQQPITRVPDRFVEELLYGLGND